MIGFDLLGHRADVAKFHAELVVGHAGLRVVGTPSVVAEGFKPCEDFIDGHADDYTRNSKQDNHAQTQVAGVEEVTRHPSATRDSMKC